MKLDLNFQVKKLDGSDFEGDQNHAGKILATYIAGLNKGNSIKLWDWAQALWKKQSLEIDRTDHEILKALVDNSELPVITKAQIIEVINNSK